MEDLDLKVTPPMRCLTCGKKTENMKEGFGWLVLNVGIAGIVLLSCPKCSSIYSNTEALHNIKKVQEHQKEQSERRIVLPGENPN